MRIMGLDYGSKTVGVAISDPLLITAQGIEIIRRKPIDPKKEGRVHTIGLVLLLIFMAVVTVSDILKKF